MLLGRTLYFFIYLFLITGVPPDSTVPHVPLRRIEISRSYIYASIGPTIDVTFEPIYAAVYGNPVSRRTRAGSLRQDRLRCGSHVRQHVREWIREFPQTNKMKAAFIAEFIAHVGCNFRIARIGTKRLYPPLTTRGVNSYRLRFLEIKGDRPTG